MIKYKVVNIQSDDYSEFLFLNHLSPKSKMITKEIKMPDFISSSY